MRRHQRAVIAKGGKAASTTANQIGTTIDCQDPVIWVGRHHDEQRPVDLALTGWTGRAVHIGDFHVKLQLSGGCVLLVHSTPAPTHSSSDTAEQSVNRWRASQRIGGHRTTRTHT
jgi:hypothetical protein